MRFARNDPQEEFAEKYEDISAMDFSLWMKILNRVPRWPKLNHNTSINSKCSRKTSSTWTTFDMIFSKISDVASPSTSPETPKILLNLSESLHASKIGKLLEY